MGWKRPVVILGFLVLLGLAGLGIHFRLDGILDDHRRDCHATLGAYPVDPSPRTAILGPAEPGNAWDCYRPAFAALRAMDPDKEWELSPEMAAMFQLLEVPVKPPAWLKTAEPFLDLCRSGARRGDTTWQGPRNPVLEAEAFRTVKALCSRGYLSWRAGRDADAAEDLMAALTLSGDVGRLGGDWKFLGMAESHILDHFSRLLSRQSLSAVQLEELARRVDLVRAARPGFSYRIRDSDARARLEILDGDPDVNDEFAAFRFHLSEQIDRRDLYSLRFARIRLLKAIRACGRDLESVPWTDGAVPTKELQQTLDRYDGRFVQDLLPYPVDVGRHEAELLNLQLLSFAVRCARYQAMNGRLPADAQQAGSTASFIKHVEFHADRIFLNTSNLGLYFTNADVRQVWPVGRRE